MRTVKEMHIYVRSNVQLMSSNRSRPLQPDEIDWELNKAQTDFLKRYIRPRQDGSFEIDTLHTSAVQGLVNNRVEIKPIRRSMEDSFPLPEDCLHPLSASVYNHQTCQFTGDTTGDVPVAKSVKVWKLAYPKSTKPTGPYYQSMILYNGVTPLFNFGSIYGGGFPTKEDNFVPLQELLTYPYLRWEKFLDLRLNNNLLFISGSNQFTDAAGIAPKLNIDGTDYPFTLEKEYTWKEPVLEPSGPLKSFRFIPHDTGETTLTSPYYKNAYQNPGGYWNNDTIHSEKYSSFTVLSMFLNYVRKPRTISLILGQHCELHTDYHKEICDLAVENIMSQIMSPAYQLKVSEDRLRGNLTT